MTENNIKMYGVNDIQAMFGCGRNTAYNLMNANGFPSIRIGKKIFVESNSLNKWIKDNEGKSVVI